MRPTSFQLVAATTALFASAANAHLAAFAKGMYCLNGSSGSVNLNSDDPVTPLYQLSQSDWWFHHVNNCDQFPPADGDFLELPAGNSFTVEIASNQAKTTLSFNGQFTSDWPDGASYPDDYNVPTCITSPNMHTQNQSQAAGTAFAIAYVSDLSQVTQENLAVFSVRYHTPWKRLTSYDVPAALPACPDGGCICAWGWVPNGCGQPNMYHQGFKCKVTGATGTAPVATAKAPVWCEDDQSKCVSGAKQMIYWNQNSGDNIAVSGSDLAGEPRSPAYNSKCGFADGAQNDIFDGSSSVTSSNSNSGSQSTTSSGSSSNSVSSNTNASNSNSNSNSSSNSNSNANANSNSGSSNSSSGSTPSSASSSPGASSPSASSPPKCKNRNARRSGSSLVKKSEDLVERSLALGAAGGLSAHRKRHPRAW